MDVHTDIEIGSDFVGYRIEEPIGHGGMGVVYRAYDLRLKRSVALKLVAPELALDERYRERFERETELAMSLEHPNVVPVHDAGDVDGRLYLVMRHVEGSDLREVLRRDGALEPARALAIGRQVAHALDAAHERGLVHRDVKPSNVLLDAREHVYLADFGLTRRLSEQGVSSAQAHSLGTPAYLAPEQIDGGSVDGRADVYSLGCLFYECLTGVPPFSGRSRLATVWAHLEEAPPAASARDARLPAAIDGVIQKAMAKEPDDRYPTCSELVRAAEEALGIGEARSNPARRRTLLGVGVLLALAAVLAGVLVARSGGEAAATAFSPRLNTLVRIDPETNAVSDVIDVPRAPEAIAVAGNSVWVYGSSKGTLSQLDAATGEIVHETTLSTVPINIDPLTGPVLAADAGGAFIVGFDVVHTRFALTRVRSDGRGQRNYPIEGEPRAIVVADGGLWALLSRGFTDHVVRIDTRSGAVTRDLRLPDASLREGVDGLSVGGGSVWVTESGSGVLHRVDVRSGATRSSDLGQYSTPPVFGLGWIWVCSVGTKEDSAMLRVDPRSLRSSFSRNALPAEDGRFAVGFGSLWRHDLPSGSIMRFDTRSGDPVGIVPVLRPPTGGLTVTSIAAGAGGVWATIGRDG